MKITDLTGRPNKPVLPYGIIVLLLLFVYTPIQYLCDKQIADITLLIIVIISVVLIGINLIFYINR